MVLLRQTTQIIPKFYQNDDSIENDFIYLNQVESSNDKKACNSKTCSFKNDCIR